MAMGNLCETLLRDLPPAAPLTLGLWTTAATAARTLLDAGSGEALVLDAGRPLGVVTTRGLTRVLVQAPEKAAHLSVRDLMEPVAVTPDGDALPAAVRHLLAAPSRRLAVVDATGKAVGILAPFHVARLCAGLDELCGRTVASAMARAVVTAGPGEMLRAVLDRMVRMGVGGVVVVEADKPRGMFTARDAVALLAGGEDVQDAPVAAVMRVPVVAISPQLALTEAVRGMDGAGAGRLAVTDAAGYLVGLLAWTDVARSLSSVLAEAEGAALRERADLYHDLYDNAAPGLFRLDPSGRPLAANRTLARLLGYRDVADFLRQARNPSHPLRLDVAERRDLLVRALAEPGPVAFETRAFSQDGTATRLFCSLRVKRDALGGPRYLEGTCAVPAAGAGDAGRGGDNGYRSIVEHQTELICRLDGDMRLLFVNTAFARYYGRTPERCVAENFRPDVPEEDAALRQSRMRAICPSRPTTGFEHRVRRPDGRERYQRWTCRAIFDAAGKVLEYQCVGRDVTARRRAQHKLRGEALLARTLLDALPLPVYSKSADRRYTGCNQAFESLVSVPREHLVGKRFEEVFTDKEAAAYAALDTQLLTRGGRQVYEATLATAGGERHLRLCKASVRDAETGEAYGLVGVALDVTDRHRAEAAAATLRASLEADVARLSRELEAAQAGRDRALSRRRDDAQFLDTVLSAVGEGVCVLSPDMTVLSVNRAMRSLYAEGGEIVGRRCHDVFHGLDTPCQDCPSLRALATRKLAMSVVPRIIDDRQSGWVELFCYPLFGDDGAVRAVVEIVRDVTAGRKLEAELAAALERAEAASRAKGAFLANMSHEIRTPLNAVLGYVQLMRGDRLEARQRERPAVVEESAATLLSLINDILDYSKIEAGRMELKAESFDLPACLEAVLKEQEVLARDKGLSLALEIASDVPRDIRGDGLRLRQVLRNLVNNAVKYTDQGGVTLRAARLGETVGPAGEGRRVVLRLTVTDTGVGIPADQQAAIFESFTQVDGGLTKRQAGTGLGLAICRLLAGLMGGEVRMESAPGRGSAFWLECPFAVAAAAPRPQEPALPSRMGALPPLSILLVEDNRINRVFATDLLESRGHRVVAAENGRAALEYLATSPVDVVLMDIQMPVMDGLAATRAIRAGHMGIDPVVPVIGLSAYALDHERERFLAAGLDDYIVKPIDVELFFEAVRRVLAGHGRPPTMAAGAVVGSKGVLDTAALFTRYRNKAGLLIRVGREFIRSVPEQLAAMDAALRDGDMRVCERVAHTLKGNAAMFGAMAMREAAAALEIAAAADDAARVDALAPGFREVCREALAGMDAFLGRMGG
jgi:PAS domain S-box-containing protein